LELVGSGQCPPDDWMERRLGGNKLSAKPLLGA
jgi:hypothetical protein